MTSPRMHITTEPFTCILGDVTHTLSVVTCILGDVTHTVFTFIWSLECESSCLTKQSLLAAKSTKLCLIHYPVCGHKYIKLGG